MVYNPHSDLPFAYWDLIEHVLSANVVLHTINVYLHAMSTPGAPI